MNWVSTVTGRLGYANNNWLFFAKGGWAWAGFDGFTTTSSTAGVLLNSGMTSLTRNGWSLRTVKWFAAHWSAKLEYDYVGFNTGDHHHGSQRRNRRRHVPDQKHGVAPQYGQGRRRLSVVEHDRF